MKLSKNESVRARIADPPSLLRRILPPVGGYMETTGIEPATYGVQNRRSPS